MIIVLIVICICILSFFFFVMKNRSALKTYFAIVSILSIGWIVVSAGVLLYSLGSKLIITDEEYIIGWNRSYEITQCDQPEYKLDKQVERSAEAKAACKQEATTRVLAARRYDEKTDIIIGTIWLVMTLIVYGFHYPKLKRMNEEAI